MNSCHHIQERLTDLHFGELPAAEAERIRSHAAGCPDCGPLLDALRDVEAHLTNALAADAPAPPVRLSDDRRRAILDAAARPAQPVSRAPQAAPPRPVLIPFLRVAAAVALLAIVMLHLVNRRAPHTDVASAPADTSAPAASATAETSAPAAAPARAETAGETAAKTAGETADQTIDLPSAPEPAEIAHAVDALVKGGDALDADMEAPATFGAAPAAIPSEKPSGKLRANAAAKRAEGGSATTHSPRPTAPRRAYATMPDKDARVAVRRGDPKAAALDLLSAADPEQQIAGLKTLAATRDPRLVADLIIYARQLDRTLDGDTSESANRLRRATADAFAALTGAPHVKTRLDRHANYRRALAGWEAWLQQHPQPAESLP